RAASVPSASRVRAPVSPGSSAACSAWSDPPTGPISGVRGTFSRAARAAAPLKTLLEFGTMDSSAIPVFQAGPFPVVYSSEIDEVEAEVQLDVALLIQGQPNIVASTAFP